MFLQALEMQENGLNSLEAWHNPWVVPGLIHYTVKGHDRPDSRERGSKIGKEK